VSGDTPELSGVRVAVVNWRDPWHHLAGGSERYAWEFATAMKEAGAEVEFWTARGADQAERDLRDGIVIRRRGGTFGFYPSVWLWFLRARWSRSRRIDVAIDAENGIPAFAPLVAGRATRVVLVMHHVHQEQFRTYFRRPMSDVGRFLEGRLMPFVYRHVRTLAVSESTHQEMRRQLGWTRPVQIVPNGADPAIHSVDQELRSLPDRLVVLGRLAAHKRIDAVVRAVAVLARERPELRLDIVGQGPEDQHLTELVDALGLQHRVTLHGFLPEDHKARLLSEARLHLCASDAEGWGQVVVEAASYGLPTLARDVPGLRDSIRDGETGWLVADPHRHDEPLVDALLSGMRRALDVLDDDARRAHVAQACRTWASRFTWANMRARVQTIVHEELRYSAPAGRRSTTT
jgi:glycosyltransferase involved in cell wall biosynthesis